MLASNKTKAEVESFCNALGRKVPFIYENGAGVENFNLPFECAEARICDKIQKLLELMRY